MNYNVEFSKQALKSISLWKKSRPALYKKLEEVLLAISVDPYHGIGHPESLIDGKGVDYSRHITAVDRIRYEVMEETANVMITKVGGHYDDK